ncbi:MAG: alginate lyase family protein [Anaerolineae bacterium]|jgi:hypothetical protein|nr:alginate lyase family protein [Anaerolineae bacterium]MBT7192097.1 alginate lyase family protein [Anaerolineae bacterium]MBT7990173.1 alginate lyase family protein [Anaerolineae bacterium]
MSLSRPSRLFKIIHHLGFTQVGLFALYKLGLKMGYYRWGINQEMKIEHRILKTLFTLPTREELLIILSNEGKKTLITEANYIVDGKFRIFGSELVDIKLDFYHPLSHWIDYETHKAQIPHTEYRKLNTALNLPLATCDLKLPWEPARFGWAFTLGRAYRVSGDETYAQTFWRYFEIFDQANPVNMGPHWMNGQEVAIRLMVFVWAAQVFDDSIDSTSQRKERLAQSVAEHAAHIPATLLYARSQNNNHLTSEAAGLYTAGLALSEYPEAEKWRKMGIKWLNWSFENQIDANGEYIQRSVNYHRLVLQLALWVNSLSTKEHEVHEEKIKLGAASCASWMTKKSQENLANATRWLAELTDPISGNAVNLGANDGAYLFSLANGDFRDFRPVVNVASQTFLGEKPFDIGAWDEMSLWLQCQNEKTEERDNQLATCTLQPAPSTWAHLRVADGNLRLAHADQLHLDLWWRGENIALDPGTYLYNAASPWDNPLPGTEFHNTVMVNNQDQMTRASRFMYLDWSRGQMIEQSDDRVIAEHDGYRKLGIIHRRSASFSENIWRVEDNFVAHSQESVRSYRLHWLLLDGEWEVESRDERIEIGLKLPQGLMNITLHSLLITHHSSPFSIARAGELLYGDAEVPLTRGWYSPTYGVKIPALSLALEVTTSDAVQFTTEFQFPNP